MDKSSQLEQVPTLVTDPEHLTLHVSQKKKMDKATKGVYDLHYFIEDQLQGGPFLVFMSATFIIPKKSSFKFSSVSFRVNQNGGAPSGASSEEVPHVIEGFRKHLARRAVGGRYPKMSAHRRLEIDSQTVY